MDLLIDTCIWTPAVRKRSPDTAIRAVVDELIVHSRVAMIGPIRQQCLSGVTDPNQYASIRSFLRTFADIPLVSEDYELAASFYNTCRSKGIQGSHVDFLICAVADREKLQIYTSDHDFERYEKHIPVRRFAP